MAEDAEDTRQALYDAYLEQALAGEAQEPEAWCAARGVEDPELLSWLRKVEGLAQVGAPESRASSSSDLPFERLGGFRLLERVGSGGSAEVYLAMQESLGRRVALKLLRPELLGDPTALERLRREALAIARLDHPHIAGVIEVGQEAGVPYLAMDWVPGRSLDEIYAAERLAPRELLNWTIDLGRALVRAHAAGVVHRDVKPSNVRIAADGRAVLIDFGIARLERAQAPTITGAFAGSPAYASPEQLRGERELDGRSDVYSLAATLYEGLAGQLPHAGSNVDELLNQVLHEDPPSLRRLHPQVDRDLAVVVEHALERRREDRYADMAAFVDDLERVLELRAIQARPPTALGRLLRWTRRNPTPAGALAVAALALLGMVGALVHGAWQERRSEERAARLELEERTAREEEARDLMVGARQLVLQRRAQLAETRRALLARKGFERMLRWRPLSDAQLARWREAEQLALRAPLEGEQLTNHVMRELARAKELDPAVRGEEELLAVLYTLREQVAVALGELDRAQFFHEQVASLGQEVEGWAAVLAPLRIEANRADAQAYLFRYRSLAQVIEGGEPRLVPLPALGERAAELPTPGQLCVRLEQDAGAWSAGDHLWELEGQRAPREREAQLEWVQRASAGASTAWGLHSGAPQEAPLPAGVRLRPSAAAPLCARAAEVELEADLELRQYGRYLVVVRAPGCAPLRVPFQVVRRRPLQVNAQLVALDAVPPGWVRVPCEATQGHAGFWIQERELSVGEFLAYLRAVPAAEHETWERAPDGTWLLPAEFAPAQPMRGLSYEQAQAYVAWRNAHDPPPIDDHEWALPDLHQWIQAASGGGELTYVHGESFGPTWQSARFAARRPEPSAGLRHPLDESVYGVYDLAGSLAEWCDRFGYGPEDPERAVAGGSWLDADPERFRIDLHRALPPDFADESLGVRLVLRPRG